jgi:hypothetical protein
MNGVVLCRAYGFDASIRRFWSGRRWVVDPSDAKLYGGAAWHRDLDRLRLKNTSDFGIVAVNNYGLVDERLVEKTVWL